VSSAVTTSQQPISLPRTRVYPELPQRREGKLDKFGIALVGRFLSRTIGLRSARLRGIVAAIDAESDELTRFDEAALRARARELGSELRRHPDFPDALVARVFALVREVSGRVLGMRHYDVQMLGAYALIKGNIAEMQTGEGKTLTATLAVATAGLAGVPVHVVTVNDYLAERDAEIMRPLYEFFGLTVGIGIHGQTPDERRAAYACDITYCTNKELAFDYLRDRIALGQYGSNLRLKVESLYGDEGRLGELILRGLHFAIVDEADSVLIDEARTPLVISGEAGSEADLLVTEQALELARVMEEGTHYRLLTDQRRVILTPVGREYLTHETEGMEGPWRGTIMREELASQALSALYLFDRDEHYLVRDGKVEIIDEYSGRVSADRFWSDGLHQMIEIKEGCEMSSRKITIARMTYQRFFRRYQKLGGMTGTGREVASELWNVYRRPMVRIPTNRPIRRRRLSDRVLATKEEKWQAIVERVAELHGRGCAVLLGTRSVAASEEASAHLDAANLPHVVLNAAQDNQEAEIVAAAGQTGRITVATNMAGRGTDIKLDDEVVNAGGLHVIMAERHDAGRIDRQLEGRSGRQGQPGCFQAILSLEDQLLEMEHVRLVPWAARLMLASGSEWLGRFALRRAQVLAERLHSRMRRDLLRSDETLGDALAFSGKAE
jgi:preprotein translocase subunit SecA